MEIIKIVHVSGLNILILWFEVEAVEQFHLKIDRLEVATVLPVLTYLHPSGFREHIVQLTHNKTCVETILHETEQLFFGDLLVDEGVVYLNHILGCEFSQKMSSFGHLRHP